jgi:hypothetical protein
LGQENQKAAPLYLQQLLYNLYCCSQLQLCVMNLDPLPPPAIDEPEVLLSVLELSAGAR